MLFRSENVIIKPPNNKLRLKGSCKKNGTKLKKFDIIKSVILKNTCYENWLDIQYKGLDKIYIYHSYNNKNFSGRWYSFQKNDYKLDGKKYILTHRQENFGSKFWYQQENFGLSHQQEN